MTQNRNEIIFFFIIFCCVSVTWFQKKKKLKFELKREEIIAWAFKAIQRFQLEIQSNSCCCTILFMKINHFLLLLLFRHSIFLLYLLRKIKQLLRHLFYLILNVPYNKYCYIKIIVSIFFYIFVFSIPNVCARIQYRKYSSFIHCDWGVNTKCEIYFFFICYLFIWHQQTMVRVSKTSNVRCKSNKRQNTTKNGRRRKNNFVISLTNRKMLMFILYIFFFLLLRVHTRHESVSINSTHNDKWLNLMWTRSFLRVK